MNLAEARSDFVALGIAFASLILFIGTAGSLMPQIVSSVQGQGAAPDTTLTSVVLLNIALLLFGWRRYADLQREILIRRDAEARAQHLAERDPLTQCLNRRSGIPALRVAIEKAQTARMDLAVLMLDLDNFKQINDINGHAAGDAALVATAARLGDLLPRAGVLMRIGGDEFACCVPFARGDTAWVDGLARRVLSAVREPFESGGMQHELTISIGIARFDCGTEAADESLCERLIHQADIAMYNAKKGGRNRVAWFEPAMEDELRNRHELGLAIREGIARGEFVPFYEQQVDIATGEIAGFEMLARWRSPTFGFVTPDTFIPIAEEMDLIAQLSESVIRQALIDARDWDPRLTLSVNISPLQLRDPWFAQRILKLLVDTGFPAGRLELEITESCLHMNIAAVRSVVTSLKNQGIRISLDDFGTGYSSISQLRALPFDRIKIDRSFVSELARDGGGDLVEAMIALGRGLNLPITAEGIETPEVLELLRGMGELKGQGYLYGMPEDAAATRALLAQHALLPGTAQAAEPVQETRRRAS